MEKRLGVGERWEAEASEHGMEEARVTPSFLIQQPKGSGWW